MAARASAGLVLCSKRLRQARDLARSPPIAGSDVTLCVYVRVQANPGLSSLRARLAKVKLQRVEVQHEAEVLRLQDEKLANLEQELIAKIAADRALQWPLN